MKALLDANVLYPTVLREILIGVAREGLFTPIWSDRILEEWARATVKLGPGAEIIARGEISVLRSDFPRASVMPPDGLADRLWLPDPNDIHVLAAAVFAGADLIVTSTHGRTGLAHLFMGSVAERVVRHAPCSVLVVRAQHA